MPEALVEDFRLSPEFMEWAKAWKQYQTITDVLKAGIQISPTQKMKEALGMVEKQKIQLMYSAPERPTKELEGQDSRPGPKLDVWDLIGGEVPLGRQLE